MMAEDSFGAIHFGAAKLGNKSRTRRLTSVATQLARHPGGTLPQKLNDPAALRATYRLMDREEVTHASVLAPHREVTRERIQAHRGPVLILCDSTELDYTHLTSLTELGQIGSGSARRRGYICQNCLAYDPEARCVLGLAEQLLHLRAETPRGESKEQSRRRTSRESRLWPEGTRDLPADPKLIVVCDRGADTFEELEHECQSGRRLVIRSCHNRRMLPGHVGTPAVEPLTPYLRRQPALGSFTLELPAATGRAAREAELSICWAAIRLMAPVQPRGEHSHQPLPLWVVRVWEPAPPRGQAGLQWTLLTNEPIDALADALRIVGWYECRWVIEDYHKAMKTGCQIEALQFAAESRLEPMIALLSVVALTLLGLRDASRRAAAKSTPARHFVPPEYVESLCLWRHQELRPDWSVQDFYFALARLGGHQNRPGDKPPGWLVLGRGWAALQLLVQGAALQQTKIKLGIT